MVPMFLSLQDYSLGDDTVLDSINLAEPDQYELPDLSAEEQAVILGVWYVCCQRILCLHRSVLYSILKTQLYMILIYQ